MVIKTNHDVQTSVIVLILEIRESFNPLSAIVHYTVHGSLTSL